MVVFAVWRSVQNVPRVSASLVLAPIVSGLAMGIDTVAHKAALGQGHELTFALGLAARVSSRLSFSLEAFGAAPLTGAVPLTGAATDAPVSADLDLLGAAWVHINPRVRLSAAAKSLNRLRELRPRSGCAAGGRSHPAG